MVKSCGCLVGTLQKIVHGEFLVHKLACDADAELITWRLFFTNEMISFYFNF